MNAAIAMLAAVDILSEIASHLDRGTLALFIQVNRTFHQVGITHLWRRLHSLAPLLNLLMPSKRLDILTQPHVLNRLRWNTFTSYARLMRMLDLTLTSEALKGYNNEFFEMLKTRQPLCLSSITTLHLSLSSNSTDFHTVLTLLGDAQITKLTIMDSIKKIYSFLCPFHQLRSITHLILHVLPTQPLFWSSLLRTWDQLTMIHIKIDGESEIEDYGRVFGNIRRLPLLQELHADCVGSSDTQETFHFPSLTTLSVTFAPNSEPTGFIDNLDAPRLSRLSITAGHYWDEPTFANLFHHISTRCNRTSLIALVVNFLELEWDYPPDVPEEFREAAFNEATVSSLYSFSLLEHLEIRPGISCHGFSDTFYGIIPLYWPRLRVFHLGGDLFYPVSIPLATLAGVASFLSNSQEIQELSLPHIRGDTLPPADKTHSTLKRIGNLFGGCEVLPSYLDWVNTCLPSVVSVGIASRTRLNFDIDPECHRYSIVPGCVKLLAYGAENEEELLMFGEESN